MDAEFQYGGDAEGTMRFLVYHNRRSYPIFQHRFINQNMAKNFAVNVRGLKQHAERLNLPLIGAETAMAGVAKISELGQAMSGDPLRDF